MRTVFNVHLGEDPAAFIRENEHRSSRDTAVVTVDGFEYHRRRSSDRDVGWLSAYAQRCVDIARSCGCVRFFLADPVADAPFLRIVAQCATPFDWPRLRFLGLDNAVGDVTVVLRAFRWPPGVALAAEAVVVGDPDGRPPRIDHLTVNHTFPGVDENAPPAVSSGTVDLLRALRPRAVTLRYRALLGTTDRYWSLVADALPSTVRECTVEVADGPVDDRGGDDADGSAASVHPGAPVACRLLRRTGMRTVRIRCDGAPAYTVPEVADALGADAHRWPSARAVDDDRGAAAASAVLEFTVADETFDTEDVERAMHRPVPPRGRWMVRVSHRGGRIGRELTGRGLERFADPLGIDKIKPPIDARKKGRSRRSKLSRQ